MKELTLLAGKEFEKKDTGGNGIYEPVLEAEVPNDLVWELQDSALFQLILTNGSNEHLPESAKIMLFKDGPNFDSPVNIPGAEMYYDRWEGFDKQDQRSDEFRDNTRISMEPDRAIFRSRESLIVQVESDVAVDVSQDSFHAKLPVTEYETRS